MYRSCPNLKNSLSQTCTSGIFPLGQIQPAAPSTNRWGTYTDSATCKKQSRSPETRVSLLLIPSWPSTWQVGVCQGRQVHSTRASDRQISLIQGLYLIVGRCEMRIIIFPPNLVFPRQSGCPSCYHERLSEELAPPMTGPPHPTHFLLANIIKK